MTELGMIAEERQLAGFVSSGELVQEERAEQSRQHAYRKEEARPARYPACAIERKSAARHDHVHMGMVGERRSPGMEDGQDANTRTQVLGIDRDCQHRLR